MGCTCAVGRDDDHREEAFKFLEVVGLRDIGERAVAVPGTTSTAVRHLEKAERAERLGLGGDVAALYRDAAERDRAQAARSYRALIRDLDERVGRDDWGPLVDRASKALEESGGAAALVDEARGRIRLAALEMDGVSADDAEAAVKVVDESLNRLQEGGLDGAVGLLRERLERGLAELDSPDMGRGHASPQTRNQIICIGIVSALAGLMSIACAISCWCCGGVGIFIWLAAAITICLLAA